MPCTAERVWRAARDAEAGTLPDPWRDPPAIFATLHAGDFGRADVRCDGNRA